MERTGAVFAAFAVIQGFAATGILAIINAVILAINPSSSGLPFSAWWGMLVMIPGLLVALWVSQDGKR